MRTAVCDSLFSGLEPEPPLPALPPGFTYERDFLSVAEEAQLLADIATLELRNSSYHEFTALRRTAGFGYRFNYETGRQHEAPPAPEFLARLAEKVAAWRGLAPREFQNVLVTEYPPGAPMGWHRDAPPYAVIHGISLASPCTFQLRPHELAVRARQPLSRASGAAREQLSAAKQQLKQQTISLTAEPRSIYVMAGESRSAWQHGLPPVERTRYSITLRTMR